MTTVLRNLSLKDRRKIIECDVWSRKVCFEVRNAEHVCKSKGKSNRMGEVKNT